ncbi:flagellin N-terminal helical domain-containing protein [Pontibaca salina]|uniref:Flagellin n=1 Tax=Pontibaca salina TaxID=2795731 RepID=A0A934HRS7_9RHOB|nr:flagellin [Pontibaca salina]MBI6629370.1 flagellin [Pontibaca salina]
MSSILTNNGAMVALQTLKAINNDLTKTQNAISTGKDIAAAKDNSAIWAITKVMETDVSGFRAISNSLSLGESTVAVASAGAEQVVNILNDMKERIVAATGENVDHSKLSAEVAAMNDQITAIINGSQFNGANLLRTDVDGNGAASLNVTASLDRSGGTVTRTQISVTSADFEAALAARTGIAVDTTANATTALDTIETLIQAAVDGAAGLGASGKRISDQNNFVGKVMDAMASGIGALVDTDMEAASARLQALQTQQQLGIQALSIANQAPQTILSLFR